MRFYHLALIERRQNLPLRSPSSLLTSSAVGSKLTYSYHHASTGLKPARPLRSTLKPLTFSTAGNRRTCRRKRKMCIALRNLEVARYPRYVLLNHCTILPFPFRIGAYRRHLLRSHREILNLKVSRFLSSSQVQQLPDLKCQEEHHRQCSVHFCSAPEGAALHRHHSHPIPPTPP
jgi:hypothetical protein